MTILTVRQEGDPILRQSAAAITDFGPWLPELAADMLETMRALKGLGLSAPQVGASVCLIVCERDGRQLTMVNPKIIRGRHTYWSLEGCLSVDPKLWGPPAVRRMDQIVVAYTDVNGFDYQVKARNKMSACIQHEIDHLNGILFTDYRSKK